MQPPLHIIYNYRGVVILLPFADLPAADDAIVAGSEEELAGLHGLSLQPGDDGRAYIADHVIVPQLQLSKV